MRCVSMKAIWISDLGPLTEGICFCLSELATSFGAVQHVRHSTCCVYICTAYDGRLSDVLPVNCVRDEELHETLKARISRRLSLACGDPHLQERKRLAAKGLSRISQSRERYLLERGGGENGANPRGPVGSLVSGVRTFVRIQEGQSVDDVAAIVNTIEQT